MEYLLKFGFAVRIPLPFNLFSESISRAQVFRVQLNCLLQIGNRFRGMAAISLKNSQQVIDVTVPRGQVARFVESVSRHVIISLAQRQHSPVRPARGLRGHELSYFGKFALGVNIVANLQRCQSNVESRNNLGICFRPAFRELCRGIASRQCGCQASHKRQ